MWAEWDMHSPGEGVQLRNYKGADKSLARPSSRCILFDGENILFIYIYIYSYVNVYIYIYIYI